MKIAAAVSILLLAVFHQAQGFFLPPGDRVVVGEDEWQLNPNPPLERRYFQEGETIVFEWAGFHNVFLHPSGTCSETDAEVVGATSTGGTATYTFPNPGIYWFACDVSDHCEASGMLQEAYVCNFFEFVIHWVVYIVTFTLVQLGCAI